MDAVMRGEGGEKRERGKKEGGERERREGKGE